MQVPTKRRMPAVTSGPPYPPARQAWYACIALTLGCVLAYMDRGVLSLFVAPIQRDLHLNDTQISLLIGFAFGVFNAIFGLPVGRLVDTGVRKTIAAIGVLAWSLAMGGGGLATSFGQLFLTRVGVGAGEAAVTPAAASLFADFFPPERRGLPMGIFYGGMFLGAGGVLVLGGMVWRLVGDRMIGLPLIGPVHSWQAILMGLAALGVVVAPLTLLIREPPRRSGGAPQPAAASASLGDLLAWYRRNGRMMVGHNVGFCLQNVAVHAGTAWLPIVLMRTLGWSLPRAGLTYGLIMLVTGPAGTILSGLLADAFVRRGHSDGKIRVSVLAGLICSAAAAGVALAPDPAFLVASLVVYSLFATFFLPLAPGALQDIMPNNLRGQGVAIYVFWTNILVAGAAPTAVALLTDYVFHDPQSVRWSFGLVASSGALSGALVLARTLAPFRSLRERLQAGETV